MQEKLILRVYPKSTAKIRDGVIRVTGEAANVLMEYQRCTGMPVKEIASKMILFAAEHTEIAEEE